MNSEASCLEDEDFNAYLLEANKGKIIKPIFMTEGEMLKKLINFNAICIVNGWKWLVNKL